tara:strand:+ start:413 stop:559 length:147 start_codon:yes stop_codon:yes gene_type:complete
MEKIKKTPKRKRVRQLTTREWQKLGLNTTTIYFVKPPWVRKMEELKKK